ncbi:WD40 repeat domain-containing protein [Candidatus Uhrbacteria bacterium]|nr:WD40 repeat domain-containing protein [Candidatus Uhrbacteria bacterium]
MIQLDPNERRFGDPAADDTTALAMDPSGSFCLTGGYRTVAHRHALRSRFPTSSWREESQPFPHALCAAHILWSPAGKRLAMIEHAGDAIHVFSGADPFDRLHRIRAWTAPFAPRGCTYSADGTLLATGTVDGHLAIHIRYDDPLYHEHRPLARLDTRIQALAFSPHDRYFVAASADGRVRWWDTEHRQGAIAGEHQCTKRDGVGALAFDPTQNTVLAVGCTDGAILLIDLRTGNHLTTLGTGATFGQRIQTLRFSNDGTLLIAGTGEGLLIYPVNGECPPFIRSHFVRPITAIACTPDEQQLVVNSTETYGANGRGRGYCTHFDFGRPNFGRG